jgi:hypothetical protein
VFCYKRIIFSVFQNLEIEFRDQLSQHGIGVADGIDPFAIDRRMAVAKDRHHGFGRATVTAGGRDVAEEDALRDRQGWTAF